jgi:hypothetical protein
MRPASCAAPCHRPPSPLRISRAAHAWRPSHLAWTPRQAARGTFSRAGTRASRKPCPAPVLCSWCDTAPRPPRALRRGPPPAQCYACASTRPVHALFAVSDVKRLGRGCTNREEALRAVRDVKCHCTVLGWLRLGRHLQLCPSLPIGRCKMFSMLPSVCHRPPAHELRRATADQYAARNAHDTPLTPA